MDYFIVLDLYFGEVGVEGEIEDDMNLELVVIRVIMGKFGRGVVVFFFCLGSDCLLCDGFG